MKPFDLEEALAGEPVKLRNGRKAYILGSLNTLIDKGFNADYPLIGIIYADPHIKLWTLDGRISLQNNEAIGDIIGMWEEPRPTVTLTLPCPLKEPREDMYRLSDDIIIKSSYKIEKPEGTYSKRAMNNGLYFATESDTQAWLDALKNSRR